MRSVMLILGVFLPIVSHAASLSLIIGGWSRHFVPGAERQALNQNQGTVGVEISTPSWNVQASRMTDSFGCDAQEIAAARKWDLFAPRQWLHGGLMLGVLAAHRCTHGVFTTSSVELVPIGTSNEYIWPNQLGNGLYADCPDPGHQPVCTIVQPQTVVTRTQAPPRWVIGLIPGIYCNIGGNLRAELTLIRSPWTGHHFVAYLQFSVKVFSF